MSDKPIFTVTSGFSKEPISLYEGTAETYGWAHICDGHGEMTNHQESVKTTLEDPTCVCSDATRPERHQYYGLGNHPRQTDNYVKVVVAPFMPTGEISVITAHTTDSISKGGTVLYVKPKL